MSNANTNTNAVALMDQFKTDMTITQADVVAAFVSRWENQLFDLKKSLNDQIVDVKKSIKALEKEVLDGVEVHRPSWVPTFPAELNTTFAWSKNEINWLVDKELVGKIVITFKITVQTEYNRPSTTEGVITRVVTANQLGRYSTYSTKLAELEGKLGQVLSEINSVARKERQVRGLLAEQKLAAHGIEDFMNMPEMVNLLEVKI